MLCLSVFFFFQAEDGIRDVAVTGVQTCALPISPLLLVGAGHRFGRGRPARSARGGRRRSGAVLATGSGVGVWLGQREGRVVSPRSEERRVGKECRSRWSAEH